MREVTIAQSTTSTGGTASVRLLVDENDKVVKIIGESNGDAWIGGVCDNPIYTLKYGYNDYKEVEVIGDYNLEELPDNFLSITLWQ